MRILQLNLNHCRAAQDLLMQRVRELGVDVAILSEQFRDVDTVPWVADTTSRAAIWACGKRPFQELTRHPEPWYTRAKIGGVNFYSCYAPPSTSIREFEDFLDKLTEDIRKRNLVAVAGDFNAWATDWGSSTTNERGQALIEALSSLDLVLLNSGNVSTFRKGTSSSIIDLTFISSALAKGENNWRVDEEFTHSDHLAILWEINTTSASRSRRDMKDYSTGWNKGAFDKEAFLVMMEEGAEDAATTAEERTKAVMDHVSRACDASMPRGRPNTRHPPVYWWNSNISQLRRKCLKARRLHQRARKQSRETTAALRFQYELKRRELRRAISASKKSCWKELCNEVDQDPWGRPYKVVMHRIKSLPMNTPTCPDIMMGIVQHLFPERPALEERHSQRIIDDIPPITQDELMRACSRLGNSKSPGPDGIPNIALKTAILRRPEMFLDMYNACMGSGVFPDRWKRQRLVLLPKGKKPPDEPSSYRPLCMLDSAGKILERIIYDRLEQQVDHKLSNQQYGFRTGRSTVDAVEHVVEIASKAVSGVRWKRGAKKYCLISTLDIKNAFNSARWDCILGALSKLHISQYLQRIITAYLRNRVLMYSTEEGPKEYKVTGGVPQGSVLGPLLWNIMYDGLLKLELPEEATLVGFADDVAMVIVRKHLEEIDTVFTASLRIVEQWLCSVGLELAEHKTELLLVTGRKVRETITLMVGEHSIQSQPHIRYLGVRLDARLNFREHITAASRKAAAVSGALSRIMPNIGGPRQAKRQLLATVVTSILLYGAPVWACSLELKTYYRIVSSVQRTTAIRVASSYRTVSQDAVCIIASIIPIDILAVERRRLHQGGTQDLRDKRIVNSEERTVSLQLWQERWDRSRRGRWTHRLIPNVDRWVNRDKGEVGYYVTQLLSGHGCFRAYLFRFRRADSPYCPCCGEVQEDAEHVFFCCPRFTEHRNYLERILDVRITPENLIESMLSSIEAWNAVTEYAENVIKLLRHSLEE